MRNTPPQELLNDNGSSNEGKAETRKPVLPIIIASAAAVATLAAFALPTLAPHSAVANDDNTTTVQPTDDGAVLESGDKDATSIAWEIVNPSGESLEGTKWVIYKTVDLAVENDTDQALVEVTDGDDEDAVKTKEEKAKAEKEAAGESDKESTVKIVVDKDGEDGKIEVGDLKANSNYYVREVENEDAEESHNLNTNIYTIPTGDPSDEPYTEITKVYNQYGDLLTYGNMSLIDGKIMTARELAVANSWGAGARAQELFRNMRQFFSGILGGNTEEAAPADTSSDSTDSDTPASTTVVVQSIKIAGPTEVDVDGTIQLTVTVSPDNATNKDVVWSSSDSTVASVDSNGNVTGHKAGVVTITATNPASGVSGTYEITVPVPVDSISILGNPTMAESMTQQLTVMFNPQDAADQTVKWESSAPEIASVDDNGLVKANAVGNATITATSSNGKTATLDITVTEYVDVTSIAFDTPKTEMNINDEQTLSVTFDPEDASDRGLVWSTDDDSVATVDNGVVTAVGEGEVTITATSTAHSAAETSVTIKVSKVAVTGIEISGPDTVVAGKTIQLEATVTPDNATYKTVTWSTEDTEFATVDAETGEVTGVSAGTATITATADGFNETHEVTVTPYVEVESIEFDNPSDAMDVNDTQTLNVTFTPSDATDQDLKWETSDDSVATVDDDGVVTAVGAGSVKITATSTVNDQATATVDITVSTVPVTSISIDGPQEVTVGEAITLEATITPDNATDKSVTWSSNDDTVSVNAETGEVTGVSAGTATITATANDSKDSENPVTATYTVTVNAAEETLTVTPGATSYKVGETITLTVTDADGEPVDDYTVTADPEDAVTIEGTTITAAAAADSVELKVTAGDATGTTTIAIEAADVAVTGISISAEDDLTTIMVGQDVQLTAKVTPTNATDQTVKWTSDAPDVATVDENSGLVHGVAASETPVVITATATNGVSNTYEITVEEDVTPSETLAIMANNRDVTSGTIYNTIDYDNDVYLTALPSEGLTGQTVTWSVENTSVMHIDGSPTGDTVKILTTNNASGGQSTTVTATIGTGDDAVSASVTIVATDMYLTVTNVMQGTASSDDSEATATVGSVFQLGITGAPADIAIAGWELLDNTGALSVDDSGVVHALEAGNDAVVIHTVDGVMLFSDITVEEAELKVTGADTVVAGETIQLTATNADGDDVTADATWTVDSDSVATVSAGEVTGVAAGTAKITAEYEGASAVFTVTVTAAEEEEPEDPGVDTQAVNDVDDEDTNNPGDDENPGNDVTEGDDQLGGFGTDDGAGDDGGNVMTPETPEEPYVPEPETPADPDPAPEPELPHESNPEETPEEN